MTFQAEDEIAAITSAIGAAYAGALAITTTSGPGMALKTEAHRPRGHGRTAARDLRHPARRPVHRACRPRPSRPTCCRPVRTQLRSADPGDRRLRRPATASGWRCEACRIALKYMVPVIVLSDGYLANGAEPWRIPRVDEFPDIPGQLRDQARRASMPYTRNPQTLARPGPFRARPDSSTASAASRSRTSPATSTTTR